MEEFTKEEALEEIFSKKPTPKECRVWKTRYKANNLSDDLINKILLQHDYIIITPAKYVKK